MTPSSSTHKPYVQAGDPLKEFLPTFWRRQIDEAEQETPDYRHPPLPLARIKKVMKSDPDVKMIAADAPIIFCKACEIFISEITARAFIVADTNKRRTLNRADIAKALSKSDQFDFLIDFMPRDDGGVAGSPTNTMPSGPSSGHPEETAAHQAYPRRPPLPHSGSSHGGPLDMDGRNDTMMDRDAASSDLYHQLNDLLRANGSRT